MTKTFDFSTIKERNFIFVKEENSNFINNGNGKDKNKDNDNDDARFYYENTYKLYG